MLFYIKIFYTLYKFNNFIRPLVTRTLFSPRRAPPLFEICSIFSLKVLSCHPRHKFFGYCGVANSPIMWIGGRGGAFYLWKVG